MVQDGEEGWVLKKTDLSQVILIDPLVFTSLPTILKVVGNTTHLMNPTSGGRSSEREVLETYLGMLECDTVKRLFDRWIACNALFLIVFLLPLRYYTDFLLFNYSLEEMLNLANNAPCTDLPR